MEIKIKDKSYRVKLNDDGLIQYRYDLEWATPAGKSIKKSGEATAIDKDSAKKLIIGTVKSPYASFGQNLVEFKITEIAKLKDSITLPAKIKNQANKIAAKYSKWLMPKEFVKMYDELNAIGIVIPAFSAPDGKAMARFEYNGEEVNNCRFVYSTYKDNTGENPKIEYTVYFS